MYDELISSLRICRRINSVNDNCIAFHDGSCEAEPVCMYELMGKAADAIEGLLAYCDNYEDGLKDAVEELCERDWIPVTERLPECKWGAEVANIEWISCGMVFAGCFGRGGKYRDTYFRTWTDGTEGIDAKDADYWRPIQITEPPKEE